MARPDGAGSPCCISHAFLAAAATNPNYIAVIHASGGAEVCRRSRSKAVATELPGDADADAYNEEDDDILNGFRVSSEPPVYEGDECFTFSDVMAAVESLSRRIRRVLDGAEDPDVRRPKGYSRSKLINNQEKSVSAEGLEDCKDEIDSSEIVHPVLNLSSSFHNTKVLLNTSGTFTLGTLPCIVGIYIVPSVEYIVSVLSILRCGAAFLPLDPSLPNHRILSILSCVKVDLIIKTSTPGIKEPSYPVETDWLVQDNKYKVLFVSIRRCVTECHGSLDLSWPCENDQQREFCYVMHTSGSTGRPKGVCGTEEGLLNRFLWMEKIFPLSKGEVLIFKTSISFVDHLQEFLSSMLSCTALVIPPYAELKENPFKLLDFLKVYRVTRLTIVPSLLRALLPAIESLQAMDFLTCLKILVLSGEIFHVSLWQSLHKLLPMTSILNLYGSTEVSGDCTYFDCKRLTTLLQTNRLISVPIGVPISNCDELIIGNQGISDEGELYVGGPCLSAGYLSDPLSMQLKSLDCVMLHQECKLAGCHNEDHTPRLYYRTGDLALRLQSGDLIFLGRKDRTIKVNGQRVSLEEIENVLRQHEDVADAAVVAFDRAQEELPYIGCYVVLKGNRTYCNEHCSHAGGKNDCLNFSLYIRSWLVKRLPMAMVPSHYFSIESLPKSSSGKVDYALLNKPSLGRKRAGDEIINDKVRHDFLQVIKELFRNSLMINEVADNDDFFLMGGNSITAAQVAHKLQIDMRLIYIFPSPFKLQNALQSKYESNSIRAMEHSINQMAGENNLGGKSVLPGETKSQYMKTFGEEKVKIFYGSHEVSVDADYVKCSKLHKEPGVTTLCHSAMLAVSVKASFTRCNKVLYDGEFKEDKISISVDAPKNNSGSMRELWTVPLELCIDASPLVVLKDDVFYLFIGSHSGIFMCMNALSGSTIWEVRLGGRIECSAAVTGDFTQIAVGCYNGKVYFLDFLSGDISWVFQTGGEVKSQPIVDVDRKLMWCGSHDHNLYALDYKKHKCVSKISCGGSIYGSPVVDEVGNKLYVASTSGLVTAISVKELPYTVVWTCNTGAPIFGSLSITFCRKIVCCLVDGHVTALDFCGSVAWKTMVGGPIFAGPCISAALPSQVLICSRDGFAYSLSLENGSILWHYNIGNPITSSAYVDEHLKLITDKSHLPDRLACICGSSGSIHVLRITTETVREGNQQGRTVDSHLLVQKFASIDLSGDIFSSPVMISGRIYVGCRDDRVHCIEVSN